MYLNKIILQLEHFKNLFLSNDVKFGRVVKYNPFYINNLLKFNSFHYANEWLALIKPNNNSVQSILNPTQYFMYYNFIPVHINSIKHYSNLDQNNPQYINFPQNTKNL